MPFSHHGSGGEGDSAEYRGWSRERSVAGWERGRCRKGPTERARREGVGPSKPTPYRRTLGGRGVLLARTGRPMKRLPKREVASAPEAPAPARACAGKRGRDLGPAPSTIDTVRMHGQNAQHATRPPKPSRRASQPRLAGARARALAGARERTKRAPTRRVRLGAPHLRRGRGARREAGGWAARRGSGWPVGGAWKCRERKRARVGGLSGTGGSRGTHEARGGGGASRGAAHLELLSSKLAFPCRGARSTRVIGSRRARLRGGQAQGWHGERG